MPAAASENCQIYQCLTLLNLNPPYLLGFSFGPIGIESDNPVADNEDCDQAWIHFVGKENGSVQFPVVD